MPTLFHEGDRPIPGHHLIQFLGEGGFGEVWKAQNPHKIEIALKIVRIQGKQGLREVLAIRQLRNIRHPNLIPIFGFWLKDQEGNILENAAAESMSGFLLDGDYQFFLAMGLGDKSLADRLQECKKESLPGIPLEELMQYMEEAARALDFLNTPQHSMGGQQKSSIEHCDIKPGNMLLVGGSVQLCDFGLARVLQHGVKQQHSASFSHHYVAPELLKRDQGPTRGTDQYSLAISYAQLRTGRLPFGDLSFAPAILTAHLEGNLDFSSLPQREQTVLRKATAMKPGERFPTVKAFVDGLKDALGSSSRIMRPTLTGMKGPLRAGTEIVPGYKLEELIGRGSFGEVWRASAPGRLKKAVKIIRNLELASGRQEMRSLELITEVRHPYLILIEAYYLLDADGELIPDEAREEENPPKADTLVIVSELAESHLGTRMHESFRQTGSGIPPTELLPYMQHVAAALDRLNQHHDIIHRDVKPENILLVSGVAKLADFGLAKALEGSSALVHTKSIGMTPAYAAPELCSGRIEEATDQYSLALTYYHLRTGRLATGDASDLSELIQAHLHNRLTFSGIPAAEEQVLRRAAARESRQRYPSCATFVQALGATFSRSQLPEDWQHAESLHESQSHGAARGGKTKDPRSSVEWEPDTNLEPQALAVQDGEATLAPGTDTVRKFTDTSREKVRQKSKSIPSLTEGPKSQRIKTQRRRRKSLAARVAVTLFLVLIVAGGVVGFIILSNPNRNVVTTSTPPAPTTPTEPEKKRTTEPVRVETRPEKVPTKPDNPIAPTITEADCLQKASVLLTEKKPAEAVVPLLEVAKHLTVTTPKPQRDQALVLAAQCRALLPDVEEAKKQTLVDTYREWANQYFTELADALRQDAPGIDWKRAAGIVSLASWEQPWVLAFQIERAIHDPQADVKALRPVVASLDKLADSRLGVYRHYLRGAARARLGEPDAAAQAFQEITSIDPSIRWDARKAEITSTLEGVYDQTKGKLLGALNWEKLGAAAPGLHDLAKFLDGIALWSGRSPSIEDHAVRFLHLIAAKSKVEELKPALDYARKEKLVEASELLPALKLAVLAQLTSSTIRSNASALEILPIGHAFIKALETGAPAVPRETLFRQLNPVIQHLKPLATAAGEVVSVRQQAAYLFGLRGRLVFENQGAPWLGEVATLDTAQADFEIAMQLLKVVPKDAGRYALYHGVCLLELQHKGWLQAMDGLRVEALAPEVQPLALFLKGSKELELARHAEVQQERLTRIKNADTQLTRCLTILDSGTNLGTFFHNLARIGASTIHLEYANYLEASDPERHLEEQRDHLKKAEQLAKAAVENASIGTLKPRAQIALGNAIEDFGLLLKENRYREASTHFAAAAKDTKGKPIYVTAKTGLGRVYLRLRELKQAETELREAALTAAGGASAWEPLYWLGQVHDQNQNWLAARDAYQQAEQLATIPYYKHHANLRSFAMLLKMPTEQPRTTTVPGRIQQINREMPRPDKIDAQVRKEAQHLRVRGLSELGNLHAMAAQFGVDPKTGPPIPRQVTHVREQINLLKAEKDDPVAQLHASRLEARVHILFREHRNALDKTNLEGKLTESVKQVGDPKSDNRLEEAVLELVTYRFEIALNANPAFVSEYPAMIKMADGLAQALGNQRQLAAIFFGHAGILRFFLRNHLDTLPAAERKEDPEVLARDAIRALERATDAHPEHRDGWKWYYLMCFLEKDKERKQRYAKECLKWAATRPEQEVLSDLKEKLDALLKGN
jgi:serine/threonine protein kinase